MWWAQHINPVSSLAHESYYPSPQKLPSILLQQPHFQDSALLPPIEMNDIASF